MPPSDEPYTDTLARTAVRWLAWSTLWLTLGVVCGQLDAAIDGMAWAWTTGLLSALCVVLGGVTAAVGGFFLGAVGVLKNLDDAALEAIRNAAE